VKVGGRNIRRAEFGTIWQKFLPGRLEMKFSTINQKDPLAVAESVSEKILHGVNNTSRPATLRLLRELLVPLLLFSVLSGS
jgi:hypothetical protein